MSGIKALFRIYYVSIQALVASAADAITDESGLTSIKALSRVRLYSDSIKVLLRLYLLQRQMPLFTSAADATKGDSTVTCMKDLSRPY